MKRNEYNALKAHSLSESSSEKVKCFIVGALSKNGFSKTRKRKKACQGTTQKAMQKWTSQAVCYAYPCIIR